MNAGNPKIATQLSSFLKILLATFMVLLLSCPVKASIKSNFTESGSWTTGINKMAIQNQALDCQLGSIHFANPTPKLATILLLALVLLGPVFRLVISHSARRTMAWPFPALPLYLRNRLLLL